MRIALHPPFGDGGYVSAANRLFARRDQPGLRQAGIEIGRWDNMVRRPFREVSNLNTENLTPCETFPARLNLPMFPFVKKGRKRKRAGTRRGR